MFHLKGRHQNAKNPPRMLKDTSRIHPKISFKTPLPISPERLLENISPESLPQSLFLITPLAPLTTLSKQLSRNLFPYLPHSISIAALFLAQVKSVLSLVFLSFCPFPQIIGYLLISIVYACWFYDAFFLG
ncbi:hypothetical protein BQ11300 [Bartonella quintana str. Toulouse]|uniref:Uncharacterized protein n=1 Tax=Bartonella quintana (strain Toulouse) TaxID=283165 RepID=A0A0H3LV41_BARQU|nr:hypothetical protein BQ11300 [Bartonella quintana str. Toulouse]